jgi:hypothetical protein
MLLPKKAIIKDEDKVMDHNGPQEADKNIIGAKDEENPSEGPIKFVGIKIRDETREQFFKYIEIKKVGSNDDAVKILIDKATKYDEVAGKLEQYAANLVSLKNDYEDIAKRYEKVKDLEIFDWLMEVPFRELPQEQIEQSAKTEGSYRAAVLAFQSGWNLQAVRTMLPNLNETQLDIALKEAESNLIYQYVTDQKSKAAIFRREQKIITEVQEIDLTDYQTIKSNSIINTYYSLWRAERPNYNKKPGDFVTECVIDAMNHRGIFLTSLVQRVLI